MAMAEQPLRSARIVSLILLAMILAGFIWAAVNAA
jgi:hypothetical protein